MAFRVEITPRAARDLRRIYQHIGADAGKQAHEWFNGLETLILSLDQWPNRGALVPEDRELRQLFYGHKPHIYRVIYAIDDAAAIVVVLHIRHAAMDTMPENRP